MTDNPAPGTIPDIATVVDNLRDDICLDLEELRAAIADLRIHTTREIDTLCSRLISAIERCR